MGNPSQNVSCCMGKIVLGMIILLIDTSILSVFHLIKNTVYEITLSEQRCKVKNSKTKNFKYTCRAREIFCRLGSKKSLCDMLRITEGICKLK